nr:hypothetical protein [Tanacetum cinerariifolium]
ERLEYIEMDQREYTLDDEDIQVQDVIMKPVPSNTDADVLKKSISCSYPHLPFNKAIKKESEKLQVELQHSQANLDVGQCEVIQHLIEVTQAVASKSESVKTQPSYLDVSSYSENHNNSESTVSRKDLLSNRGPYQDEEWHSDLLGCCSEPMMCIKTLLIPCSTFSKIASVATGRQMTSAEACNELMAYSLILSCCCYTCCIRRKLRKTLNITGGWCDDFLSHLMCCCCALVQELREVEMRGIHGKSSPKITLTKPYHRPQARMVKSKTYRDQFRFVKKLMLHSTFVQWRTRES